MRTGGGREEKRGGGGGKSTSREAKKQMGGKREGEKDKDKLKGEKSMPLPGKASAVRPICM